MMQVQVPYATSLHVHCRWCWPEYQIYSPAEPYKRELLNQRVWLSTDFIPLIAANKLLLGLWFWGDFSKIHTQDPWNTKKDLPSTLWIKIRPSVVPGHGCLSRMHWEQCGCLLSHYNPHVQLATNTYGTPFFLQQLSACLPLSFFVCMSCIHESSENLVSLCLMLQSYV